LRPESLEKLPKAPSRKHKIILDAGTYGLSVYTLKILGVFNKFLLLKFLGPVQVGMWQFLAMLVDWGEYSNLGVSNSVMQHIPRAIARHEIDKARHIEDLAFTFTFITALIFSGGAVLFALLNRQTLTPVLFKALIMIAGFIFVQQLANVVSFLLKSYQKFQFLSALNFVTGFSLIVLTVIFASKWKIHGWIFALVCANLLWLVLSIGKIPAIRFCPIRKEISGLILSGLSLIGLEVVVSSFRTVDRFFISHMLGFHEMGFYSLALTASTGMHLFPYALGIVTFPHYQQEYTKRWNAKDVKPLVSKPMLVLIYTLPFLISFGWILLPQFLSAWLPTFIPGLEAARFLILGSYFLCLTQPLTAFLVTVHRELYLFLGAGLIIGTLALAEFLLIKNGAGIAAIAIASSGAFFCYFSWAFYLSLRSFRGSQNFRTIYFKALIIFGYVSLLLFFLDKYHLDFVPSLLVLSIVLAPLLFAMERETRIFSAIGELWAKRNIKK